MLKVGGKLIYSTCTITEDENERMIAWTLEKFTCLTLVPAEPLLGGPGLPFCGLTDEQRYVFVRVYQAKCIFLKNYLSFHPTA